MNLEENTSQKLPNAPLVKAPYLWMQRISNNKWLQWVTFPKYPQKQHWKRLILEAFVSKYSSHGVEYLTLWLSV